VVSETREGRVAGLDLPSVFALALALVLGAFVRLVHVLSSDFPLNDGGLFYVMIEDLRRSHYALPMYASYNSAGIPFAYPPLPFYVAALLSDLTRLPALEIVRLVPAIISVLTIPAFYVLSRSLLPSATQSAFAVFAFALLPRAFEWLIMGGGLTRSMGLLFALLALHQALKLYRSRDKRFAISTALLAALAVLSHPETALLTALSIGVLFLFAGRNRDGWTLSILVASGVTILTLPWWGTVIARYGFSPLLSAAQTGDQAWYSWFALVLFNFTDEPLLQVLGFMGLLGLFACLAQRRFLLPAWLAAVFIVEPRSAPTYGSIPLAMLAGIGLDQVVLPALAGLERASRVTRNGQNKRDAVWQTELGHTLGGTTAKLALTFFTLYALLAAWSVRLSARTPLNPLPQSEREAMQWVSRNTPAESKFLVITLARHWSLDAPSEWFPALTGRISLQTVQGHEWLPGEFNEFADHYGQLQACTLQDADALEEWADRAGHGFTHVYISKKGIMASGLKDCRTDLSNSLLGSGYTLVYENEGAAVFRRPSVSVRGAELRHSKSLVFFGVPTLGFGGNTPS
jgi:hypothetical protein